MVIARNRRVFALTQERADAMDNKLRQLLELVKRSPQDADGWRKVSKPIWPLVANMPTDLVALEPSADGGGRLRLTDRGQAVSDYL